MIKIDVSTILAITIFSILTVATATAAEQPKAEDLVGHVYGGIHGLHIQTDDERLMTADPLSDMDYGNGIGGEVGYRWLPSTEFRFNYSKISLTSANEGYAEPDGASTAIDLLYFPTDKNFYLLTGVNNLDIGNSQISGNLGAGYRHYLSSRSAIYFEGKANYQFSEHYDEFTTQIGFVYFFGDNTKPIKLPKPPVPVTKPTPKPAPKPTPKLTPEVTSIQLLVKFDHNTAIVKPQYHPEISTMADFLNKNKDVSLIINGHTSSLGSHAYNKVLSLKRAEAIVNLLVDKYEIMASRLSAVGYGEEQLINLGNTITAHSENRRIEAEVEVKPKVTIKR